MDFRAQKLPGVGSGWRGGSGLVSSSSQSPNHLQRWEVVPLGVVGNNATSSFVPTRNSLTKHPSQKANSELLPPHIY